MAFTRLGPIAKRGLCTLGQGITPWLGTGGWWAEVGRLLAGVFSKRTKRTQLLNTISYFLAKLYQNVRVNVPNGDLNRIFARWGGDEKKVGVSLFQWLRRIVIRPETL